MVLAVLAAMLVGTVGLCAGDAGDAVTVMINRMCGVCEIFGKFEGYNEDQSIKQGKICTNV